MAFLDSEDVWYPWKLSFQMACLTRVPEVGMIWTEMIALDRAGHVLPRSSLRDILPFRVPLNELFDGRLPLAEIQETPLAWNNGGLYVGDIYALMVLGNLVLPSSALLRRSRLEVAARFDETLEVAGEDFEFFLRVCQEGEVAFSDVPSVLYQTGRADQLTHPSRTLHLGNRRALALTFEAMTPASARIRALELARRLKRRRRRAWARASDARRRPTGPS